MCFVRCERYNVKNKISEEIWKPEDRLSERMTLGVIGDTLKRKSKGAKLADVRKEKGTKKETNEKLPVYAQVYRKTSLERAVWKNRKHGIPLIWDAINRVFAVEIIKTIIIRKTDVMLRVTNTNAWHFSY